MAEQTDIEIVNTPSTTLNGSPAEGTAVEIIEDSTTIISQTMAAPTVIATVPIGPQGIQGIQGIQGTQGIQGDAGTTDYNELDNLPDLGTASALDTEDVVLADGDAQAVWVGTQGEYDAIDPHDGQTLYVISEGLIFLGDTAVGGAAGIAGGVLSGTYPNPGFAVDMATQSELDAEAALARNADNLTSGTVADARIASTIARDSEVTSAVSAEATARDAAIASAIANLIDSSPGALDTLNELAAALGDDPNFAATVTNALATKQPIDADLTALAAANNSGVLAATTASFTTADETKLDGVEALADVTDAANVTAAGAVMSGTAAGGVLGGTYPNPTFAADMATQAELDAVSDSLEDVEAAVDAQPDARGGIVVSGGFADVASVDVQEFTTPGSHTWTKPSNLTASAIVRVFMQSGGGGGGSGRKGAEASDRAGGAGGGAGPVVMFERLASSLANTEAVTVGAGGAGGGARSTNNQDGAGGVSGGVSSFGGVSTVASDLGFGGGSTLTPALQTGLASAWTAGDLNNGIGGTGTSNSGLIAFGGSGGHSGGGGGGQWRNTANTNAPFGAGGGGPGTGGAGGTAGAAGGTSTEGTRGGGGGSGGAVATVGGAGGWPGGGGGGGGAGINSVNNSGAGGAGAAGYVRIVTVR